MNLLTIDGFSKAYTDKVLFKDASFSLQEGEKVGVIGTNGKGKSTLLKIIMEIEETDEGKVIKGNNVKMAYLPQTPVFDKDANVLEAALNNLANVDSVMTANAKSMLNQFEINDFEASVNNLSGGQQKRIALVNTLLQRVEILVLDEPTNHLDNEMSSFLEDYLYKTKMAVVMVTHDRYFLDRVVDRIVEVDNEKIYSYPGTYAEFVGLKMQRQNMQLATDQKRKSILRKELEWLGRGARARSTKQKAHIQRIEDMLEIKDTVLESSVDMFSIASRMGNKTIEINNISKEYSQKKLINNFSYIFLRDDRVGIVGKNGCGKSTLLKMLVGEYIPDNGYIEIGETIKIGYFAQNNVKMDPEMKAIDYVKQIAEYIDTGDGRITASALMERFLFDSTMQYSKIGKLSGGEKRRLYLMHILMHAPNVLIFDEPTNDLDISTLNVLEDFLDTFKGIIIVASHDRYFLDRIVKRIFAFEKDGVITQYEGNYSEYLLKRSKADTTNIMTKTINKSENKSRSFEKQDNNIPKKLKFSYNEQREYDVIDKEISSIEDRLAKLQEDITLNATNSFKLREIMEEQTKLNEQLEAKMDRWMYLNELAEKING